MTTARSLKDILSRRGFLKGASLGVGLPLLGGVLTACSGTSPQTAAQAASAPHDMTPAPQQPAGISADEMDAMHEAGVKAFVAGVKTEGLGNQPLGRGFGFCGVEHPADHVAAEDILSVTVVKVTKNAT